MGESRYTAAFMGKDGQVATRAVDVAIIPPLQVQQRLVPLNASTLAPPDGFRFGPTRLAHLTIAQQFIEGTQLPTLIDQVAALLEPIGPVQLTTTTVSKHGSASTLGIAPSPSLTDLHSQVMDLLKAFEGNGEQQDRSAFFTAGDTPRSNDITYVTDFRRFSAYTGYDPHITLGIGEVRQSVPQITFVADRIGLYHLGTFCTCRRALADWTLTARR